MKRPVEPISDRNPRVVSAVKLVDPAHRRKTGLFLAEGPNAVGAALSTGAAVEVFLTGQALDRHGDLLGGAQAHLVSDRVARQLSGTVTSPGLFAVCRQVTVPLGHALAGARLVAVLVEPNDPGNVGTVIRVADAAGADAVVLAGESVDPHNGKCVRASAGSVFHVPVARERDTSAVLAALKQARLTVAATTARGQVELTDPHAEVLGGHTAWLFGNEAHGLPGWVLGQADVTVGIPIHGRAESLNLATAATLCLYESARRRRRRIPFAG